MINLAFPKLNVFTIVILIELKPMKKILFPVIATLFALQCFSQLNQAWTTQYNNTSSTLPWIDQAFKVISDGTGNIYVTGGAHGDVITIKYDVSGNVKWTARHNGAYNGADAGNNLALDGLGNLYVVGYEGVGTGVSSDFVVLKYDTAGNFLWRRAATGNMGSGQDQARGVKCDAAGNVCITGSIVNFSVSKDIYTIKYDANGNTLWSATLNSSVSSNDEGMDLDFDSAGNTYVAGYLSASGGNSKALLLKYNLTGVQQYTVTPLGTGLDFYSDVDIAAGDKIYCAGKVGIQGGNGIVTRYNTAGTQVWTQSYNGMTTAMDQFLEMELDGNGGIYLVGDGNDPTNTDHEMLTAKYDTAGTFLWAKRFTGNGTFDDQGYSIALDASGNVWSCGVIQTTTTSGNIAVTQYNPSGTLLYSDTYNAGSNGNDIATSLVYYNNNVFVVGYSAQNVMNNYDYALAKYNTAGSRTFINFYDPGTGPKDVSNAVTKDASGNIYIAGTTNTAYNTGNDILVLKYNSAGTFQWQYTYNGSAGASDDLATGIAVDAAGNVYVSGYVTGSASQKDGIAIMLNAAGAQQWATIYNNATQNKDDAFNGIQVDASGNVYVTGYTTATATTTNIVTVKYNSSGVQQWAPTFNGTGTNSNDVGTDLQVDASGNVYVTGKGYFNTSLDDIMAIKYTSAGVQSWAWNLNNTTTYNDLGKFIRLAPNGDVFVTGYKGTSFGTTDIYTYRLNSAGVGQGSHTITNNNGSEEPYGMTIDPTGRPLIVGTYTPAGLATDIQTIRYSPALSLQWAKYKSGNSSISADVGSSIYYSSATGKIYASGTVENGSLRYKDMAILVYDTLGNELNYRSVDNAQNTNDNATYAFEDANNSISLIGYFGWNTDQDILIGNYCAPASVGSFSVSTATVCEGTQGVTYAVNPVLGATSYAWSWGGSGVTINGSGTSVTLDFALGATTDTIFVSAVNLCGTGNPLKFKVTVNPKPNLTMSINTNDTVCTHALTTFSPGGTGYSTMLWSPGGYTNTGNRGYYIDSAMTVTIIGTSNQGCKDTASISMNVVPVPLASFTSSNTTIVPNSTVNYSDLSTGATAWNWVFDGGVPNTSTAQNPSGINYPVAGSYFTELMVTNAYGCTDTIKLLYYVDVSGPLPALMEIYKNGTNYYYSTDGTEAEDKHQLITFNDTSGNGYVTKIDGGGDVIWTTKFNGTRVYDVVAADSNHYYIGSTVPKGSGGTRTVITMLNKNGVMQWQKLFDDGSIFDFYIVSMAATTDKGFVMLLQCHPPTGADGGLLCKLDTLGNVQWSKQIYNNFNCTPGQVIQCHNGDIAFVATSGASGSGSSWFVARYSLAGVFQWQEVISHNQTVSQTAKIQEMPDSSFILLGDDAILGPANSQYIAALDKNGNSLWAKRISYWGWYYTIGIGAKANSDIILAASYQGYQTPSYFTHHFFTLGYNSTMDTLKWTAEMKGSSDWGNSLFANFYDVKMKVMKDNDIAFYGTYHEPSTDLRSPIMLRADNSGDFGGCYQDTLVPTISALSIISPTSGATVVSYTITPTAYSNTFSSISLTHSPCTSAVVLTAETFAEQTATALLGIFPNPTGGEVNIVCPSASGEIKLFDAMGRLVIRQNNTQRNMFLDLSGIAAGIYTVEWTGTEGRLVSKLVKE
jgi:uncharacterized delta-60 repeat protein